MKKPAENRKDFIMTVFVFTAFLIFIQMFALFAFTANAENDEDEIDAARLEKFNNAVNSGTVVRVDPGIARGGRNPNAVGGDLGNCIVSSAGNVPMGTNVTYSVAPGFTFGQGLSEARIIWKAERGGQVIARQAIPLFPQNTGGVIKNLNNTSFDVRSDQAGDVTVTMVIQYRTLGSGSNDFQTATAAPSRTTFNAGIAVQQPPVGVIPGQNPGVNPVVPGANPNIPAGSGVVTSCKIPMKIEKTGTPETKELTPNSWKFADPGISMPKSNPARPKGLIEAAIRGTGPLRIDYHKEIADSDDDPNNTDYEPSTTPGRRYLRAGIPVDGDGPDINTLEPHWKVKFPEVSLSGGGWSATYPREVLPDRTGNPLTYSMPEPTEPFASLIELRIKHTYIDYKFRSNQGQINQARNMYKSIADRSAFNVPDGATDVVYEGPNLRVDGGVVDPRGTSDMIATVTGKVSYTVMEGGREDNPNTAEDEHRDDRPVRKEQPAGGQYTCGTVSSHDRDQTTPECATTYEQVLDITAPKIEFLSGSSLRGNSEVDCGSGDLVLIRVKVTDNNRYTPIRIPYLTYETTPGQQCGVPLRMEPGPGTPDATVANRPFPANIGIYYSLAPVPSNIKGDRAIKWTVDAFDGAGAPHPHNFLNSPAFGNHNMGDFFDNGRGYNGNGPAPDVHARTTNPNASGFLSIYDNDRPNINIKMWKVDRGGMYVVGDFSANEDYMLEDCYYRHTPPPPDPVCNIADSQDGFGNYKGFKGAIPEDNILLNPVSRPGFPFFPPSSFYSASRQNDVKANLANQIEDVNTNRFKYFAGFGSGLPGNCPVVFEDVKYLFTIDADDNIDTISRGGTIVRIPSKLQKLKFSFQFNDRYSEPDRAMAAMEEIDFDETSGLVRNASQYAKPWYLGPIDPSVPLAPGAAMPKDVPTFEHVFHNVTPAQYGASNPDPGCSLKVSVMDCSGHWRHSIVFFKIKEVSNELRVLEEKVKRDHRAAAR